MCAFSWLQCFPKLTCMFRLSRALASTFLLGFAVLFFALLAVFLASEVLALFVIKAGYVILPVFFYALAPILNVSRRPAVSVDFVRT